MFFGKPCVITLACFTEKELVSGRKVLYYDCRTKLPWPDLWDVVQSWEHWDHNLSQLNVNDKPFLKSHLKRRKLGLTSEIQFDLMSQIEWLCVQKVGTYYTTGYWFWTILRAAYILIWFFKDMPKNWQTELCGSWVCNGGWSSYLREISFFFLSWIVGTGKQCRNSISLSHWVDTHGSLQTLSRC